MKIILEDEKPMSWNNFYAGKHWTFREDEARRVHTLVHLQTLQYKRFTKPVDIIITVYGDRKLLDCDNIPAKLYIDGLKSKVIIDDTPKWVDSVTTRSRVDKTRPRVTIEIHETKTTER